MRDRDSKRAAELSLGSDARFDGAAPALDARTGGRYCVK